ncbi:flagellar biosynthesis protein [Polynucleobacter paneuropaeus]|uniref:Flagellar biosynthesis protein n=1 Tax=Polynucleobacter paneuropaeus TaxID=2527775 RepID=A0A2Z4JU83_9BURK|nr:flagellar biosynthesis protein [Polynucleobacter paneuropaeus]AWW50243.1 flagellar biosynthesis protein [Polynucleobacter paneuropaeus]
MNITSKLIICVISALAIGGCATSRSTLDIQLPKGQPSQSNGKQVYINSIVDKRSFQVSPPNPDIPSLDPSEDQTEQIKMRAIGRKRNGFGKALGDMLLKDGETVQSLTDKSIRQAFEDKGYSIVANKDGVTKDTYIVDVNIEKFWAWMNPGFWQITLSSEISTDVIIKSSKGTTNQQISVKAADGYQVATESNWMEIIQKSIQLYINDLKSKLN